MISATMIVKNEAANLQRCFDSILGVVDEIIVVDTGSIDAFGYASGDWYFVIDADEELLLPEGTPEELVERIDKIDSGITALCMQEEEVGGTCRWMTTRFLRASAEPYYENARHNKLRFKSEKAVAMTNLKLIHHGYSLSIDAMYDKHLQAIDGLVARLSKNPNDADAMYHMAQSSIGIGDFNAVVRWCEKCFKQIGNRSPSTLQYLGVMYFWGAMAYVSLALRSEDEKDASFNIGGALAWITKGLGFFPEDLDMNLGMARVCYHCGRDADFFNYAHKYLRLLAKQRKADGRYQRAIPLRKYVALPTENGRGADVLGPKEKESVMSGKESLEQGAEVVDEHREGVTPDDFDAIFEDEKVSESELMGEEPPQEEEESADSESKGEEEKPEESEEKAEESDEESEEKSEEESEENSEEESEEKSEEKPEDDSGEKAPEKPPPGFVPLAALHEERANSQTLRAKTRELEDQVHKLEAEANELRTKTAEDPRDAEFKDFNVLSDAEYAQMVEDDPEEAQKYQYRFVRYNQYLADKRQVEEGQRARTAAEQREMQEVESAVQSAWRRMQQDVPGLGVPEDKTVDELVEFALNNGFDDEGTISLLTHPGTMILPPDKEGKPNKSGKPMPLGNMAAQLVRFVHKTYQNKPVDMAQLRSEVEADLRPQLEKEIGAKLAKKFKNTGAGDFTSITETPGSTEQPAGTKVLTESELAKLSKAEQERYLMGG